MVVNLRSFRQKARHHKTAFRRFLTKFRKNLPRNADELAAATETEVWQELDCLTCANCCRQMSPTYTAPDIKRIAAFLDMSPAAFKDKWLYKDRVGDWLNKSTPCQFLDLVTNKCKVYAVRPADCAGFPHLSRRKFKEYIHVHQQNVEWCPATYRMVEKLMEKMQQPGC